MGPATTLVQIHKLSKGFKEGRHTRMVLDEVCAEFGQGEFVVLLGKSGSGKSTLLNLISGIEKPTSGDVTINDLTITNLSERERTQFRRDHIGFVFQFFNLIPTLTVLENVMLPLQLAGFDTRQIGERSEQLIEQVFLSDRVNSFPDRLSGGEQQRVAIARALAHDPILILADEPTGNLDEDTGGQVLNLLLEMVQDTGKTLVMATHNEDMIPLADRVFHIVDGRLIADPNMGTM